MRKNLNSKLNRLVYWSLSYSNDLYLASPYIVKAIDSFTTENYLSMTMSLYKAAKIVKGGKPTNSDNNSN